MKAIYQGNELTASCVVGSGGSSEEVYSTEETRIGIWIDGKPLYKKVYFWTGTYQLSTSRTSQAVGNVPANVDLYVSCYGSISFSNRVTTTFVPGAQLGAISSTIDAWNGQIHLINVWNTTVDVVNKIVLILTYTKTTDTATKSIASTSNAAIKLSASAMPLDNIQVAPVTATGAEVVITKMEDENDEQN